MKNLPWKAEKQPMGWVIRDNKGNLVFIAQDGNPEIEKDHCEIVCGLVNSTFKFLCEK
jgi:hypothetical protein